MDDTKAVSPDANAALDAVARADATFASNLLCRMLAEMQDGTFTPQSGARFAQNLLGAYYKSEDPEINAALERRASEHAFRLKPLPKHG